MLPKDERFAHWNSLVSPQQSSGQSAVSWCREVNLPSLGGITSAVSIGCPDIIIELPFIKDFEMQQRKIALKRG
jgi:hypothetical protein